MRLTRIHQIAARGGDLNQTKQFYQDVLGARYIATYEPPGIMFFDFNGTRILFEREARLATLYFWVDDMDSASRQLEEQGVDFDGEPHMIHRDEEGVFDNPGTEEWMRFFSDPAGNTIGLSTRR